jgi:beta-lactamase regulating signal transducer with metallopeptidase domain
MIRLHYLTVSISLLFVPMLDATVKGTCVLLLACGACLLLRRDSAATRHLVWATAVTLLLAMPLLSVLLPKWHVLPNWSPASPDVTISSRPSSKPIAVTRDAAERLRSPDLLDNDSGDRKQIFQPRPAALPTVEFSPAPAHEQSLNAGQDPLATLVLQPAALLTIVWFVGCVLVLLRLVVAAVMLRSSAQRCQNVTSLDVDTVSPPSERCPGEHALRVALMAAAARLGVKRSVQLLLDPGKSMPVVWGLLRLRMRLPGEAVDWSAEQQQSVLLHELAHVRRNDLLILTMTQIACALNWFNPLVWFAAWRLHVERERACDDLVLDAGLRPSTYAGHLVDVVSRLQSAAWDHACGLAMARKSSLESRVTAVLSEQVNRRGMTRMLSTAVLVVGMLVAFPVAMLHATSDEARLAAAIPPQTRAQNDLKPKHEYAQSLFRKWQARARTDGKIPGALIGQIAKEIDVFLKQSPANEKSPKLASLRPRLDSSHDWTQAEAIALLDEITDTSTAPVSWADLPMEFAGMRMLHAGKPLPVELKSAAWGAPQASGLRAAYLLEPRAEQYALGSVVKTRVLFHNSGTVPVVFTTETWHQEDKHSARDAKGAEITVKATWFTGITPTATYRLAPGEYCEVLGHGLAIGVGAYEEEFSTGAMGAIIEAKEGDHVTLSHSVGAAEQRWTKPDDPKDPAELWKRVVAERVADEAPMPQSAADREQLIRRVTRDLFGETPTAEDVAAFTADDSLDALAKLTTRLQGKPGIKPWTGTLPTGATNFRVIAVDPTAAKAPRSANSPGRYVLADHVHLLVSQTTTDAQRTNKAVIAFLSPDPKVASPYEPYPVALPDGLATYGIAWERGACLLWILQKGLVRKYDFTNPAEVKETRIEPGSIMDAPEHLRDALRKAFDVPGAPVQQQNSLKQKVGAKLSPSAEAFEGHGLLPRSKESQALFKIWNQSARANGKIPGGLIGLLAESVRTFTKYNPTVEATPKLLEMLPRLDGTHDWIARDAMALLDEVASLTRTPIFIASEKEVEQIVSAGTPLPKELANAPWGEPSPKGLCLAWLLEPRAGEYRLGAPLMSHILIHNAGKNTVVFRTRTWHQANHKATDAKGVEINVTSMFWTTLPRLLPYRLAPGEYVELNAPGIGVGADTNIEDWQNVRVGSWVEAKVGDEVTVAGAPVPLCDWNEEPPAAGEPGWWLDFITARLARLRPLPADVAERTRLLHQIAMELFGQPLGTEERAAFIADHQPDALDALAKRLAHHVGVVPFSGSLTSGPIRFRVLPADPDAAKRPRTANNPGRYTLGESIRLVVTRRPVGERIVNEARIQFFSPDPTKPAPGVPYELKLPDGYDTWAAAWMRGGTVMWLQEKNGVRSYDFSNPAKMKAEIVDPERVPAEVREALREAIVAPVSRSATQRF